MKRNIKTLYGTLILVVSLTIVLGIMNFVVDLYSPPGHINLISKPHLLISKKPSSPTEKINSFDSKEDFKDYIQEGTEDLYSQETLGGGFDTPLAGERIGLRAPASQEKSSVPERVSETTVQVAGIDEPDIVKTNGEQIFFSAIRSYYIRRWTEIMPPQIKGKTNIIQAFPPADLEIASSIDKGGDMLLYQNTLILFSGKNIYGYDISTPQQSEQEWKIQLEDNTRLIEARLYEGKIYLVTRDSIDPINPCPIKPLSVNGNHLEIKCSHIYHPVEPVPVDVTYNAVVFDALTGEAEKNISFVGTANSSVLYMSKDNLYVTYYYQQSPIKFFSRFFEDECSDIIPEWLLSGLKKLQGYDISEAAKMTEFRVLVNRFYRSLSNDERLRIENEIQNRIQEYYQKHKRSLEKTGIAQIELESFQVQSHGTVPGRPLNQFSLDEYDSHLRIATTIGERGIGWSLGIPGATRGSQSANDVYVLDSDLNVVGSVKDLGLEERIYSARFIQDKGYLVTFRQIDPFFVLDLSDHQNPQLKGELKIPGYSSYLHPLDENQILGIGKEGGSVKISLFDVTDPAKPKEESKYLLNEYWSDVLSTHHAFLLDKKHRVFFLPGRKGGYVFSYDDELRLVKAVSGLRAKRAVYIDDYLYILGEEELVVIDENKWERINELEY